MEDYDSFTLPLPYIVNTTNADGLATQGAKTCVAKVWIRS